MALQHLRSNTASKRPTAGAMSDGQIAVNTNATSPGLFFKDAGGSIIKVGPVHVGTTAPNSSPAGSTGNSLGEQWLDTSGGGYVLKVWDGSAWRSEVGEFVDAAGDTMTGDLIMNNANIVFEGSTDDGFETTLTVVDPTADRTITLPNVTGTVVTTGDTGTVTSTMIADGTIVNADVNASAAIAGTKIAPDFGSQTIETTGVINAGSGTAAAPSVSVGATDNGLYSPGTDQVAISTNGAQALYINADGDILVADGNRMEIDEIRARDGAGLKLFDDAGAGIFVEDGGNVGIGTSSPSRRLSVQNSAVNTEGIALYRNTGDGTLMAGLAQDADGHGEIRVNNTSGTRNVQIRGNGISYFNGGNVGIGTSSPNFTAHIAGAKNTSQLFVAAPAISAANDYAQIGFGLTGTVYGAMRVGFDNPAGVSNTYLSFFNDNGSGLQERLHIDSSGRVGIGTSSPSNTLHVVGAGRFNVSGANNAVIASDGGDPFIYTEQAAALKLGTNSAVRMTINSSGSVGIGTSSPARKLDVNGTSYFRDAVDLYNPSGGAVFSTQLTFGSAALPSAARIFAQTETGTAGNLRLQTAQTGTGTLTTRMLIDSSGRVGIGTTSPSRQLQVENASGNAVAAIVSGTGSSSFLLLGDTADDNIGQIAYSNVDNALFFDTNGSERVRIDSSGRLLVGTSSDSGGALLQVNGNRIRVATAKTPSSASDTGTAGEICWDASYIYVCTATNTWKRAALSTW